ncbi:hypothetical protein V495_08094, partial [Pseudogymnoascus sp. VKM F-4514 (FW-929)]
MRGIQVSKYVSGPSALTVTNH